jgi:hypothetical protein
MRQDSVQPGSDETTRGRLAHREHHHAARESLPMPMHRTSESREGDAVDPSGVQHDPRIRRQFAGVPHLVNRYDTEGAGGAGRPSTCASGSDTALRGRHAGKARAGQLLEEPAARNVMRLSHASGARTSCGKRPGTATPNGRRHGTVMSLLVGKSQRARTMASVQPRDSDGG